MVTLRRTLSLGALSLAWLATRGAAAQTPGPAAAAAPTASSAEGDGAPATPAPTAQARSSAGPRLHHAPIATGKAHEDLLVRMSLVHPELVRRIVLVYRSASGGLVEVECRRGFESEYVGTIPADAVAHPSVAYAIELERLDGVRVPSFATRARPHVVQVPDDLEDLREEAMSQRLDQRRSVFSTSGEYVSFGKSEGTKVFRDGTSVTDLVPDNYYRIEGAYTYRPLRVITEFSMRIGVVRGSSPVYATDVDPEGLDPYHVGLNYGAPTVRFRLADQVHLEAEFLTSVTQSGFSVGTGGAMLIGDPYGSKLTLGFESIQVFGTRFYSRLDVQAHERVRLAPVIEVTDMPSAKDYGVRLLGEVAVDVGSGFGVAVRGGYQARQNTQGGFTAGGSLSYAF